YNRYYRQSTLLTASGEIHFLVDTSWQKIQHNYSEAINQGHSIFADLNGDYWIPTSGSGIYKVSKEPFTKIELSEEFLSHAMTLPYVFPSGRILLSNFNNKTFIEKSVNSHEFTQYNFSTLGITKVNDTYYFATNHGLKEYNPILSNQVQNKFYRTQTISSIFSHKNNLWFGIAGKGLYKYDLSKNKTSTPNVNGGRMPSHIYSSLLSDDGKTIYFGTNSGIYELSVETEVLQQIYFNSADLGSYSGLSTKDSFGNNWFSLEKGIVAISKSGEIKTFQGEELFNSSLFYTLIADNIGNLIVGTNKGLTIFKLDSNANILSHKVYDEKTNFLGYETNMRSQFKTGNEILLGTVEGVFQVNTQYLENLPNPLAPVITIVNNSNEKKDLDAFSFMFSLNNPKINTIHYSYSIDGEEWQNLNNQENSVLINDLSSGDHVIEVKASYDGKKFGESTTQLLSVNVPLWKTPWFIGAIIAGLFFVNLVLLNYYKAFNGGRLINTKDLDVHLNLTPAILLFAAITTPLTLILAPIMDSQLSLNIGTTLVTTFILFSLYLSSISARSSKKMHLYSTFLRVGLFVIMTDFLWEVYDSKLHPYNIIGVILISSMAPYILSKIKDTAVFAVLVLFASIIIILMLNGDVVYPKYYFLLGMSVSSFLMIFYSFLRYDSLEKLIFVSAIINRGNMPVIAFDKEGTVNYSSENISKFLDISHNEILDKNITVLNNFIPFDCTFKDRDITKEFKDGEKYLTPMVDKNSEVRWMEWACRDFSPNVKLILGQDVTKKMELENTYELLVQHAEDFIYKCDNRGNFNFINNASIAKLGYSKAELIGTNSIRIVEEKHKDEVVRFYREHFVNKNMTSYKEFPIIKKNGERVWVGQSITTLYSPGSKSQIEGFIALARDITEVRTQQRLIREQSESITSSINYARRIQHNLLPSISQFEESFKEHFIFSKPRDIVSGDFYWMEKIGDNTILVLGDCTGHGVPGSFMTLLGFNVLNSTVLENRITDPGKILNKVDRKLIEYLPRGTGKNIVNDAMELTICVFNDKTNDL
ncbi:MAG TPA: PAS domain S-box protein, partial [Crocinitomicaceae bacterium]|nr:PAS domain S-box protein [Crocinitomicaceae bacterium]